MTEAPVTDKPATRHWKLFAGAFMCVYIFGLPGLQVLTNQSSQFYYHFSFATYLWYLVVVALASLPVAGLLYFAWRPAGGLEPFQRVLAALVLTLPVPVYLQLAAVKLQWFHLSAGLEHRYALVVWVALLLPIAASARVFRGARKAAGVTAKLLSPLPFVMAVSFLAAPSLPSVRQPAPDALQEARPGAPVYILLFDALDRERIFQPANAARFPTLFELRRQGVWFPHSRTHGHGTVEVVPCFLYQRKAAVSRAENGDYLLDGEPSGTLDSVFTRLNRGQALRVAGGFHLNYSRLLDGHTDWLREYSYYNRDDSLPGIAGTHAQLLLKNMYLPKNPPVGALQQVSGVEVFPHDTSDHILRELEAQLFACAEAPNHDLVVFFHMPVPHGPFLYDRGGRRLEVPDPQEPTDEAYLKNVEYVDALLARFIEALRGSGQWDDATLVVTGDHGLEYHEHPALLVRLPRQQLGRVVEQEFYSTGLVSWLEQQPEYAKR